MCLSRPLNFFRNEGSRKPGCRWDVGPLGALPDLCQRRLPPEALHTKPQLDPEWAEAGRWGSAAGLGRLGRPPQGAWLTGSTGCAQAGSCRHWRLSPLARPGRYRPGLNSPVSGLGNTDSGNWLLVTPLEDQGQIFGASRNACFRRWFSGLNGLVQVKEASHNARWVNRSQPPRWDDDYSPQVLQHHVTSESLPDTVGRSTC